jgi:hypothetical protein
MDLSKKQSESAAPFPKMRWGGQGHAVVSDSNAHRSPSREMLNRFHSKKQLVIENLFILVEIW